RPHPRRRTDRAGGRAPPRNRPRARRGRPRAPQRPQARGLPHAGRADRRAQEGRPPQGPQGAAVLQEVSASSPGEALALPRRLFGTDGVRGVVGDELTEELVERLGRAFARWTEGADVLIWRDTAAPRPAPEGVLA